MRTRFKITLLAITALQSVALAQTKTAPADHWVSTWATAEPLTSTTTLATGRGPAAASGAQAPQPQQARVQPPAAPAGASGGRGRGSGIGPANIPTSFNDQTVRMVVHSSIGGHRVRVQFSNAFSGSEVTIGAAHIAVRAKESAIAPGTDRVLTFDGKPSCTIRPGVLMFSDPVDMDVAPLSDLAVSIYLPKDTGPPTNHQLGMHTAWFSKGDLTAQQSMPESATPTRVYFWLSSVDVAASPAAFAIVALGDSITDGQGTTLDANLNWTARLAARLGANKATSDIAVLNQGVAGGQVLRDQAGVSALARFDRDVLSRPGVKWMVVFEGINDLNLHGQTDSRDPLTSDDMIAAYRQLIDRAHTYGIKVMGATITPAETRLGSDNVESIRNTVNQWTRTSHAFDAVVDFDAAVRDPSHVRGLRPDFDSGDHIHISDAGNQAMADSFDLKAFRK